jgi:hypothetical protein
VPAKQGSPQHQQFSKAHNSLQFACGFQNSVGLFHHKIMQTASRSHTKSSKPKLDKGNPNTKSIKGLNLAAVKPLTVQVTELPLQHKANYKA